MKASRFLVSGIVQGVGFRFFAVRAARARGVKGWVRNLRDGRVEILAVGNEDSVGAFREDLMRGPPGATVHDVEESEEPVAGGIAGFDVRF